MVRRTLVLVLVIATASLGGGSAVAAERCFGKAADIVGTSGKDKLNGTSRADVIVAGDGRDRINGKGGNDLICAGDGHDVVRGNAGNDQIDGGSGADFVVSHDGDDTLRGDAGGDVLIAGNGNDEIRAGGSAFDLLIGGAGDDIYDGGNGNTDVASLEQAPVGVNVNLGQSAPQNTNEGVDTFIGVEGVAGTAFNDTLTGQDVPAELGNGLFGLDGSDVLFGLDGNDVLVGGPGNDDLAGGLDGGAGNDEIHGDDFGELFLSQGGDDDLFGGTGDDLLDGGGNFTGPPKGDYGDGGAHQSGDQCMNLEDASTTECEKFMRAGARGVDSAERPASPWLGAWLRVASI